jgi:large subunit ribosomal protein L5
MPVGLTVTLRDVRAYEFVDRLTSVALPRLRDFRGLEPEVLRRPRQLQHGHPGAVIFPEIDYDAVDQVRGLDVAFTTSAHTDSEAFTLLDALGMPFARDGRPKQYESIRAGEPVAA